MVFALGFFDMRLFASFLRLLEVPAGYVPAEPNGAEPVLAILKPVDVDRFLASATIEK
jgi:hypothetical protein